MRATKNPHSLAPKRLVHSPFGVACIGGLRRASIALCIALGLMTSALHAESKVTASLSQDSMSVEESIDFILSLEGGGQVELPREIQVDGLKIQFRGQSERTQIINGKYSSSVDVNYAVSASKPGTFRIPALQLKVEGKAIATEPLTLTVIAEGEVDPDAAAKAPQYFAEITFPKKTAYLGEMLPVDLRLYVDARIPWEPIQMPTLEGEGFTKQKMPEPRRETAKRNGKTYDVLTFRTAIAPSKAGTIQVGPSEIPIHAELTRAKRSRGNSMLDDFFNGAVNRQVQRLEVKAPQVELEVKPLPTQGRPKEFSGAIGEFTFTAEGTPARVKIGDPITMKLKIGGRGNFDRINAPTLVEPDGWHAYPPSSEFKPADDLAIGGTKTFEVAVIPETRKLTMPVFSFCYFNPSTGKYVTLNSTPAKLEVLPSAAPERPATPAPAAATATPAPTPPPAPTDILSVLNEPGTAHESFEALQPRFYHAQIWPAAGLLLLLVTRLLRKDPATAQRAELKASRSQLARQLQASNLSDPEFLNTAAKLIQVQCALVNGRPPASIDSVDATAASDPATVRVLDSVFQRRAELLYAGSETASATPLERAPILKAIESFTATHA